MGKKRLELAMDWEIYGVDHAYRERGDLRLDLAGRRFMLGFSADSTVREGELAPFSELKRIHYGYAEYLHERDWPAEDEPAVQVVVRFDFRSGWLRFEQADYAKFGSRGYSSPQLLQDLEAISAAASTRFRPIRTKERLGSNWPE